MRIIKKIIFWLLAIFASLATLVYLVAFFLAPDLPEGAKPVIEKVISQPLPDLILGDTGFVSSNGVNIWYESINPAGKSKGTILLVMGIGVDGLEWSPYFIKPLVDSGYHVIRYDHRATGLSDRMSNWSKSNAYTMEDMAEDTKVIIDTLGIDKVHIVGLSMGGMIAQTFAIRYPDRTISLTSIMSSPYIEDTTLVPIPRIMVARLAASTIRYKFPDNEKNKISRKIAAREVLYGKPLSLERVKALSEDALFNIRHRKDQNYFAFAQHGTAIHLSGSRIDALKNLKIPTMVIHGTTDPLINIIHGKKTAEIIPNAETLWIEGMGHDFPPEHTEEIHRGIFRIIDKASRQ
ncbi:MAG: alpha/beta fold hydrolase [Cytophagaceae bacterium]